MANGQALSRDAVVAVIGTGAMGAGIAQIAAQAGHRVLLFDSRTGAADDAARRLGATFDALASKGRMTADEARAAAARIEPVHTPGACVSAKLVVEAIVYKSVRIATRLGVFAAVCHAVAPRLTQIGLNTAFNMFPDSAAAQGKKGEPAKQEPLSPEQMAFAQLTQGIHW